MGDVEVCIDLVRHERGPAGLDLQEGDPALLTPLDYHGAVWPGDLPGVVRELDLYVAANTPRGRAGLNEQRTSEFGYCPQNRQQR